MLYIIIAMSEELSYFEQLAKREIDRLRRLKEAEERAKKSSPTVFRKLSFLEQLTVMYQGPAKPERFNGSRDATRSEIAKQIKESKEEQT